MRFALKVRIRKEQFWGDLGSEIERTLRRGRRRSRRHLMGRDRCALKLRLIESVGTGTERTTPCVFFSLFRVPPSLESSYFRVFLCLLVARQSGAQLIGLFGVLCAIKCILSTGYCPRAL